MEEPQWLLGSVLLCPVAGLVSTILGLSTGNHLLTVAGIASILVGIVYVVLFLAAVVRLVMWILTLPVRMLRRRQNQAQPGTSEEASRDGAGRAPRDNGCAEAVGLMLPTVVVLGQIVLWIHVFGG